MPPRLVRENVPIHRFVQDGGIYHRNEPSHTFMIRSLSPLLAISILTEEAKRGIEILERLKILGQTKK